MKLSLLAVVVFVTIVASLAGCSNSGGDSGSGASNTALGNANSSVPLGAPSGAVK